MQLPSVSCAACVTLSIRDITEAPPLDASSHVLRYDLCAYNVVMDKVAAFNSLRDAAYLMSLHGPRKTFDLYEFAVDVWGRLYPQWMDTLSTYVLLFPQASTKHLRTRRYRAKHRGNPIAYRPNRRGNGRHTVQTAQWWWYNLIRLSRDDKSWSWWGTRKALDNTVKYE